MGESPRGKVRPAEATTGKTATGDRWGGVYTGAGSASRAAVQSLGSGSRRTEDFGRISRQRLDAPLAAVLQSRPMPALPPPDEAAAAEPPAAAAGPSFSPLYQQIKALLVKSLQGGEWRPGEAIPSEMDLAARFRVSQGTVRKAIDELATDNLLVRRQGKGTFVATHAEENIQYRFL
eukprot:gene40203-53132_t